jgi:hypothetical protein
MLGELHQTHIVPLAKPKVPFDTNSPSDINVVLRFRMAAGKSNAAGGAERSADWRHRCNRSYTRLAAGARDRSEHPAGTGLEYTSSRSPHNEEA